MSLRNHVRLFLFVSVVWALFWIAGWPDYYRQYPSGLMGLFVAALLPGLGFVAWRLLSPVRERRWAKSVVYSIYFTVPFFLYDYLYCGLHLGYGLKFIFIYWYASAYYVLPWFVLPGMAYWLDSKAVARGMRKG